MLKTLLIASTYGFLSLFLLLPLAVVLHAALQGGLSLFFESLVEPEALSAISLTLFVAAVCVPLSTLFGIISAWCISKFEFRGKQLLITLLDLPFAVSPVITGLCYVLLYGAHGYLAPWLEALGIQVIFSVTGIVLVTLFVTAPYVARELIPLMQEQGTEEEVAATTLGATGLQTFLFVTLPNIKWALLYGVIVCNARAMGEFGAVSVVSGHIRGRTTTLPLQVEILYNEYNVVAAFSIASLLVLLAFITLILKGLVTRKMISTEGAL